jgi:ABC-type sulfate transport system substrate-binding protein
MVAHTELACRLVCGTTAERAAAVTDGAQVDLPWDSGDEDVPAFEHWRRRIAQAWASDDADARSPWTVGSLVEK